MKKFLVTILLSVMVFTLMAYASENETFLRLPVRVLSGGNTVENLTKDDFNLRIDGKKTEIAHFIKMNRSLAQDNTVRNFVLAFNIKDYYGQQIADGISYFVNNLLREGDSLVVWSPVKVYVIPTDKDKNTIIETVQNIVKKDTLQFKNDISSVNVMLNEIIRKYKTESDETVEERINKSSMMTATHVFLSNYLRELMNYRNRFILPNILKTREIVGLLTEKNGQKWIINFQDREIIPNYINYKPVADQILAFAERVMEKDAPSSTRMYKIIELIDKMMLVSEILPMKEITTALVDANISYNALLLKSPGDRNTMGESVAYSVDDTFKHFSKFTGGTTALTSNLSEGLEIIRKANDTYYDLIFKVQDQSKEIAITVDLAKDSKAKAYYKQLFTKKEIEAIFGALNESGINITGFDLKDQRLKFSISGYQLSSPGNKDQGLIRIRVNLFDEKNTMVYKTEKTLNSQEKSIDFSLELPKKYQGDFTISINAVDLVSLKSTQLNQYAKL